MWQNCAQITQNQTYQSCILKWFFNIILVFTNLENEFNVIHVHWPLVQGMVRAPNMWGHPYIKLHMISLGHYCTNRPLLCVCKLKVNMSKNTLKVCDPIATQIFHVMFSRKTSYPKFWVKSLQWFWREMSICTFYSPIEQHTNLIMVYHNSLHFCS